MKDCRNCKQFDSCVSGKQAHENGSRFGYCADSCPDFKRQNRISYQPVSSRSESISRSAIRLDGYLNPKYFA